MECNGGWNEGLGIRKDMGDSRSVRRRSEDRGTHWSGVTTTTEVLGGIRSDVMGNELKKETLSSFSGTSLLEFG